MVIAEFIAVRERKVTPILSLRTCLDLELIKRINILNVNKGFNSICKKKGFFKLVLFLIVN